MVVVKMLVAGTGRDYSRSHGECFTVPARGLKLNKGLRLKIPLLGPGVSQPLLQAIEGYFVPLLGKLP